MQRKYYEAYDDRYRQIHEAGLAWFGDSPSPIVGEVIKKYGIRKDSKLLELGCGEGRDALPLLTQGFDLLATDISGEAIDYCRGHFPQFASDFAVLDCVSGALDEKFDFIFAVAVVHMLVEDRDRDGFYRFIRNHLATDGVALICSMGDGKTQVRSDAAKAFDLQQRNCRGKMVTVAGTSCAMVDGETFEKEIARNGLQILEMGQTSVPNEFSDMMYAVVKMGDELESILRCHAARYPQMQPEDAVKLIYQNEFGGGHLIRSEEAALHYLRQEYAATEKDPGAPRYEDIGNGIVRVYLASLSREELEQLGQDFIRSAKGRTGDLRRFVKKLSVLRRLTEQGLFAFTPAQLEDYLTSYEKAGYPMVSHSESYRNAYRPAYRIICR